METWFVYTLAADGFKEPFCSGFSDDEQGKRAKHRRWYFNIIGWHHTREDAEYAWARHLLVTFPDADEGVVARAEGIIEREDERENAQNPERIAERMKSLDIS